MTVSTTLGQRIGSRVRARRWSRLRVLLVIAVVGAALVGAAWVLLFTGLLGVRSVEVTGTSRLTAEHVAAVAAIEDGTPLARLDTATAATRVGALPPVRSVEVTRRWPSGVLITVHERVPAAVTSRGPGYVLLDADGVWFAHVSKRPRGLPLVSAPATAGRPALVAAMRVLDSVPSAVRVQVREVRALSRDAVTLRLTQDRSVVWGAPERDARKGAVLAALMSRKAKVYDVSAPDAPVTRR